MQLDTKIWPPNCVGYFFGLKRHRKKDECNIGTSIVSDTDDRYTTFEADLVVLMGHKIIPWEIKHNLGTKLLNFLVS